jgi:hypothetical protein
MTPATSRCPSARERPDAAGRRALRAFRGFHPASARLGAPPTDGIGRLEPEHASPEDMPDPPTAVLFLPNQA